MACDLCGKEPADSTAFTSVGATYEIDLCARHTKALATALAPYVKASRSVDAPAKVRSRSAAPKRAAKRATAKKATAKKARPRARRSSAVAEIRAWGQANGLTVATKGRIRPDVVAAYEAAHAMSKPRARRVATTSA